MPSWYIGTALTVREVLDAAGFVTPEPLNRVLPSTQDARLQWAFGLPVQFVRSLVYELYVTGGGPRVDVAIEMIPARASIHLIQSDEDSQAENAQDRFGLAVRAICHRHVRSHEKGIWIESDHPHRAITCPGLFINVGSVLGSPQSSIDLKTRLNTTLLANTLSELAGCFDAIPSLPPVDCLTRALAALPQTADLFAIGLFPGRDSGEPRWRLCVRRLSGPEIVDVISWMFPNDPHYLSEVRQLLSLDLLPSISIDVGTRVGARLGLELYSGASTSSNNDGRWRTIRDYLRARRLDAIPNLDWLGGHCEVRSSVVRLPWATPICRRLSHIKLVVGPSKGCEVKAYLGYQLHQ